MATAEEAPSSRSEGHAFLRRGIAAAGGSLLGALSAGALSGALRAPMDRAGGAVREAALFSPLALPIALLIAPLAMFLSSQRTHAFAARLHARDRIARRAASALIVAPVAAVVWVGLAARTGQFFFTAFHHVGLATLAQATALAMLTGVVLVATAGVRRAVEYALPDNVHRRRALVPAFALGIVLAIALVSIGIHTGDTQGHGHLLGAYGVLKKPELDLSPVYGLAGAFALAALFTPFLAVRWPTAVASLFLAFPLAALLLRHVAHHFDDAPSAVMIAARPSLSRTVLRYLRKRTDHDRDGASALFGGGDCNDHDPHVFPNARDIPGNGVDEDCSGRDAPRPPPPPPPPPPTVHQRLLRETPADMNLVIVTVDTMRWDLHFAGNPHPLSPNLDRLAGESVVFDHAYALSSYTGKAVGPFMIGRYPSECARDWEHFTTYLRSNVFLAERLHDAGFATMGAASHFYFQRGFGLSQGMDVWDMSAMPPMDEQETSTTDARVMDRALALLNAPDNAHRRFFLWVHLFDPHKQYVPHPDLPSFGNRERDRYDAEVENSDRQIGRLLAALDASAFGPRTIVMVTADHGEAFDEHGMSYHGVEIWDELVRVPWIVRVPGIAPRHIETPRSQIDLVPTVLDLLRMPAPAADAPDALAGTSLVPDLLGSPQPPRPVYIELPEGPFNDLRRAVIDHGWKLTERGSGTAELYDLTNDPGERHNLARTRPDELARMRNVMESVRSGLHPFQVRH